MSDYQLIHLGAENCVTGSCHWLKINGLNLMVDCGMAQGEDPSISMDRWPVAPEMIDYLLITHAHIDHIGRIPEMIQKGFAGEIICSHPTKQLLHPMLSDAMRFTGFSGKTADGIQKRIDELSWGFEYNETFDLAKGVSFRLSRAGHILGSCFIRIEDGNSGWSVLFSGDIGAFDTPILPDPEPPESADLVVLESTYGDRLHDNREQRIRQLGTILTRALADSGKVFIPAFSLGRTQELIYEMDRIFSDPVYQKMFPDLQGKRRPPVFVDSPLGLAITEIYASLSQYWDQEAKALYHKGDHPLDFKGLYAVQNHSDHLRIRDIQGPAVILAGSGMCTGGRIVDHLKNSVEHPENDILFVGYQASGTLGRAIQQSARQEDGSIRIDGERKKLKARVYNLAGYSAHADQKGLVDWIRGMPEKPGRIKLVHGTKRARMALAEVLRHKGYRI